MTRTAHRPVSGLNVVSEGKRLKAAPFVVSAFVLAALFVALYLFFVRTYVGQIVDERAFIGANASQDSITKFSSALLNVLPVVAIGAGLIAALVIAAVRRNWRVLIVAAIAVAGANLSTELLKYTVLSRPHTGATYPLSNSFPSGHTTVAASVSLALFLVSSARARPYVAMGGVLFSVAAGTFLLVSQWHRPSDVIAGFVVVAFWACVAGCILSWSRIPAPEKPSRSRLVFLWWLAGAFAAIAVVTFLVSFLTVDQTGSHLRIAYFGGISAITAVGLTFAASGNRLFRGLP